MSGSASCSEYRLRKSILSVAIFYTRLAYFFAQVGFNSENDGNDKKIAQSRQESRANNEEGGREKG
jgi:hypothetical protein